jgi:hypothetical protein
MDKLHSILELIGLLVGIGVGAYAALWIKRFLNERGNNHD